MQKLVDDLNGKLAEQTVRFGLDGEFYEIDLTTANADRLRNKVLGPYVAAARKQQTKLTVVRGSKQSGAEKKAAAVRAIKIRDWAKSQGIEVKDRGRLPADVVAKYEAAQAA